MIKKKAPKYSLENFSAGHFFEDLTDEDSFYCKKFFGGLSIYVYGRMVAFLCEHPGDREWRGEKFKSDIWNGCLIPSMYEYQNDLMKDLKGASSHPVIEKWLYLPQTSKHFETSMFRLAEMIKRKSLLVGIEPDLKSKKKTKSNRPNSVETRTRISDMRNLGPAVEKDLNAAGIYTASDVIQLGPEKTFIKMLEGRMKTNRSAKCCNALYLYSIYGAIHNLDWRAIPAKKKKEFKILTEKMRRSGKFERK